MDSGGQAVAGAVVRVRPTEIASLRGLAKTVQTLAEQREGSMLTGDATDRSGKAGRFRVAPLEPRHYDLRVELDGFAWSEVRNVPAGTEELRVVLSPAPRVVGRILRADRRPVPRAEVTLQSSATDVRVVGVSPLAWALEDVDVLGETTRQAATGDDGRFAIHAYAAGAYQLVVEAEGFMPTRQAVVIANGIAFDAGEITLQPVQPIAGRVIAPDGAPVVGASVLVLDTRRIDSLGTIEDLGRSALAAETTGEDGGFVLSRLRSGSYRLVVARDGFAPKLVENVRTGTVDITVRLETGMTITGIVVDAEDRRPVRGALVRGSLRFSEEATTDLQGRFELRGLAEARSGESDLALQVTVSHDEYEFLLTNVHVPRPDTSLELEIHRTALIRGVVLDLSDHAVKGARVWIEVPGLPQDFVKLSSVVHICRPVVTGGDGLFNVRPPDGVFGRTFEVVAAHPGYAKTRRRLLAKGEDLGPRGLEMHLAEATALEGRVSEVSGAPVPGARLSASQEAELTQDAMIHAAMLPPSCEHVTYSAADGTYSLNGLQPGTYQVSVVAIGRARKDLDEVNVGATPARLDVILEAGGKSWGRVVDHRGAPLAGVEVVAFLEREFSDERVEGQAGGTNAGLSAQVVEIVELAGIGVASARTDSVGQFVLTEVPERHFRVVARAQGYDRAQLRQAAAGKALPDLVLVPFARLRGRVIGAAAGLPMGAFGVSIATKRDGQWWPEWRLEHRVSHGEGTYLYDNLRPGEYRVGVHSEGLVASHRYVVLAAGDEVELDFELEEGSRVVGEAFLADSGAPVANLCVRLERVEARMDLYDPFEPRHQTSTGNDGRFEIAGVASGEWRISVSSFDYYLDDAATLKLSLPAPAPDVVRIPLRLAGHVEGRIRGLPGRDQGGEVHPFLLFERRRVASPLTEPQGVPPEDTGGEPVAPDGTFAADGLEPGRYSVYLELLTEEEWRHSGSSRHLTPHRKYLGDVDVRGGETVRFDADVR